MPHKSRSKGKKSVLGKRKNSPNVTQSTKDPTAGCPDYTKWPPQCSPNTRVPLPSGEEPGDIGTLQSAASLRRIKANKVYCHSLAPLCSKAQWAHRKFFKVPAYINRAFACGFFIAVRVAHLQPVRRLFRRVQVLLRRRAQIPKRCMCKETTAHITLAVLRADNPQALTRASFIMAAARSEMARRGLLRPLTLHLERLHGRTRETLTLQVRRDSEEGRLWQMSRILQELCAAAGLLGTRDGQPRGLSPHVSVVRLARQRCKKAMRHPDKNCKAIPRDAWEDLRDVSAGAFTITELELCHVDSRADNGYYNVLDVLPLQERSYRRATHRMRYIGRPDGASLAPDESQALAEHLCTVQHLCLQAACVAGTLSHSHLSALCPPAAQAASAEPGGPGPDQEEPSDLGSLSSSESRDLDAADAGPPGGPAAAAEPECCSSPAAHPQRELAAEAAQHSGSADPGACSSGPSSQTAPPLRQPAQGPAAAEQGAGASGMVVEASPPAPEPPSTLPVSELADPQADVRGHPVTEAHAGVMQAVAELQRLATKAEVGAMVVAHALSAVELLQEASWQAVAHVPIVQPIARQELPAAGPIQGAATCSDDSSYVALSLDPDTDSEDDEDGEDVSALRQAAGSEGPSSHRHKRLVDSSLFAAEVAEGNRCDIILPMSDLPFRDCFDSEGE